jgi:hypothetical protein
MCSTAAVVICGTLWQVAVTPKNGIRVEWLAADMHKRLPLGSTRQQVEEWFASHQITPGTISDGKDLVGLCGEVPNSSWFESAEICIEFCFDSRDRLKGSWIERVPWWP